ncbi:TonB-dependent receptor [Flammeovirga agarivorans]|uniref:TonB-dependent receptor n=1 Tax=Flammeovirga agarivorans TaxID=2726742 RepID=A0A7X8XYQ8_9BACT|nr:TonB-dependent receptor [Flammeovirga agarivorans]NLR94457.1 TonB-dependent receptor [Flammeovirga agarivorans]
MNKKLTLFLYFITVALAFSQEKGTVITGSVMSEKGLPIDNVIVGIEGKNIVTFSDKDGYFSLKKVKQTKFNLIFTRLGYKKMVKAVDLENQPSSEFNIVLIEDVVAIDEVVITGKSNSTTVEESGFAVQSIDLEVFKNSTIDMNQVLNRTSGVRIRESGGVGSDYNFSLNGLSDYRVRFFVDDIPTDYLGDAYKLNNFPVNLIDRVDVYKGVVPVDLGADALGGAVNIIPTETLDSYLDASYSYGSFNTHRLAVNSQYRHEKSGFTVRPKLFYNFSNNNYTMYDMEVYVDKEWKTVDVERFHDDFMSYTAMLEGGFTQVKWADDLIIGHSFTRTEDDAQTDFYGNPRGEVRSEEDSHITTLKYSKSNLLDDRMSVKLFAVYNTRNFISIDTTSNRYNWLGEVTRVTNDNSAELFNQKTLYEFEQKTFIYRGNVKYKLFENHTINANYIGYQVERQGENRLGTPENEPFRTPNKLRKNIFGISYNAHLMSNRLNLNVALKNYHFYMYTRNAKYLKDHSVEIEDLETTKSEMGYAISGRYFILPQLLIKSSFERGYRLPEPVEVFGDGLAIYANPELQPEATYNLNFGFNYNPSFGKNKLKTGVNFFRRDVDNFTFRESFIRGSRYENILSVLIYGYELDLEWQWNNRLFWNANISRQYVLNNEKVDATGDESRVYRDQLPNTPYLFGNLGASYSLLPSKKVGLLLSYNLNYVHEFFLGYESIAQGGEKNIIPTQLLHNVGITASTKDNRYNISLESKNIFNALAFDNFNIQKPGRAFYMKVRYFLR